ncbi:hypothetical protein AB0L16_02455 [Streptomyces orinoci]|uniref:Translation initiation factor IF-2 n=2 Tax=Streptomyces orinoci TaxID=67339 RepID=A0ABV3JR08_STRON|nr:hypothetical protein [Streptomyces orinoci]
MQLLRPEDGIRVSYTVNPGSVFSEGLEDYLYDLGATVLSWREAKRRRFDLAVACAVHPSMRGLHAPLLVMPHGAGYNRLVTESTGDPSAPAGLSRRELMHRGKVLPEIIGVSHRDQIARLAATCREAVPHARLIGDYCLDRIRASMPRRDLYRERMGVTGGQRLVLVNSTWSEHSLLGRHPDLPLRLVAALPADEFKVALVLHPNVWARHSRHRVYERLGKAMDAGLLVLPPEEGWRAAIVASDLVVGDHGSTSFYSAALRRVVLLAATGLDELDPASPAAAFGRTAPRLDPEGDLLAQLLDADGRHKPDDLAEVVERQLGGPGEGGQLLREIMYSFLEHRDIPAPTGKWQPLPVPEPSPRQRPAPATWDVTGEIHPDGSVAVRRWPVIAELHEESRGFLAVTDQETHPLWQASAAVAARTVLDADRPPADWLAQRLADYPGLDVLVAALAEDRCLVLLRRGRVLLEAHTQRAWGEPDRRLDPVLLGAAVNLWLNEGRSAADLGRGLRLRTGPRGLRIAFTTRP